MPIRSIASNLAQFSRSFDAVTRRDLFIRQNVTEDGWRLSKVPQRRLSRGSTTNNATLTLSSNGLEQRRIGRSPPSLRRSASIYF